MKTFYEKQLSLKLEFSSLHSNEALYQKIMELGKKLPTFNPEWKCPDSLVLGCQSIMHLHARQKEGLVYFSVASDALISAGLGALLIALYNGETPEIILKNSPSSFFEEIGISGNLTPSRMNGLASLYLKMKQEALKLLIQEKKAHN